MKRQGRAYAAGLKRTKKEKCQCEARLILYPSLRPPSQYSLNRDLMVLVLFSTSKVQGHPRSGPGVMAQKVGERVEGGQRSLEDGLEGGI